jgi:hypothetical membrane protein
MTKLDRPLLLFGVAAAAAFTLNFLVLGALLPHYDPVSQTISELGERGSPFEATFRVVTLIVAICLCLFTIGLFHFSLSRGYSVAPAILFAVYPVAEVGLSIFESPHPLHNVFGISSMVGFLSPLAVALTWTRNPQLRRTRYLSMAAGFLLLIEIGLNLSPLFVNFGKSDYIRTHYGAIQRSLYFTFYGWLAYLAIMLFRRSTQEERAGRAT